MVYYQHTQECSQTLYVFSYAQPAWALGDGRNGKPRNILVIEVEIDTNLAVADFAQVLQTIGNWVTASQSLVLRPFFAFFPVFLFVWLSHLFGQSSDSERIVSICFASSAAISGRCDEMSVFSAVSTERS